jgi:hypothetical protein
MFHFLGSKNERYLYGAVLFIFVFTIHSAVGGVQPFFIVWNGNRCMRVRIIQKLSNRNVKCPRVRVLNLIF